MTPSPPKAHWVALAAPIFSSIDAVTDNQLKLIKNISAKSCCTAKRFDQNGKLGSMPPSKMKVGGV